MKLILVLAVFCVGCSTTFARHSETLDTATGAVRTVDTTFTASLLDLRVSNKGAEAGAAAIGTEKLPMSDNAAEVIPEACEAIVKGAVQGVVPGP